MLKKFLPIIFLFAGFNVNASLLSYGGYVHDTDTDIVTGGGLEWLQWDRTAGASTTDILGLLGTIEGGGWTIANNTQMSSLFNAFNFGLAFDTTASTVQFVDTGYVYPDTQAETDVLFISMFGDSYEASGSSYCYNLHCFADSRALFMEDINDDTKINSALVFDDYQDTSGSTHNGGAAIYGQTYELNALHGDDRLGWALVRSTATVPEPSIIALFAAGLFGIGFARRRKA